MCKAWNVKFVNLSKAFVGFRVNTIYLSYTETDYLHYC